jgi:hypothetical protein
MVEELPVVVMVYPPVPLVIGAKAPPFMLANHVTVAVGLADTAAVKLAANGSDPPTVSLAGWVVTVGAYRTVSVAGEVVRVPEVLVSTASYWLPF